MLDNKIHITNLINTLAEEISAEVIKDSGSIVEGDSQLIKAELDQLWKSADSYKSNITFNSQAAFASFKDRIQQEPVIETVSQPKVVKMWQRSQWITSVAASVALLIGAWYLYPTDVVTLENMGDTPKEFALNDGSNLFLFPGAVLEMSKAFSSEDRNLFLKNGQVVAEVESSKVPFVMNMDGKEIVVTGTKFSADFDDKVTINLYEGSIEYLYDGELIVCNAGSKLVHDYASGSIDKTFGVDKSIIDFVNGKLSFIDTPLNDVFLRLEQFYNIEFVINDELPSDLHFTSVVLDNQSIENIIKTLEVSFDLNINKVDDRSYTLEF